MQRFYYTPLRADLAPSDYYLFADLERMLQRNPRFIDGYQPPRKLRRIFWEKAKILARHVYICARLVDCQRTRHPGRG